ncbi:MAG TPA: hypothetical protein VJH22_07400 [Candidatus Nanoarchaeia archaeon]|nr:hypothetical protein [Candidatus Nanoarchaeia archaeon]
MALVDELKIKLSRYQANQIIFTHHAKEQALIRGIRLAEVIDNIINPRRLEHIKEQTAEFQHEVEYDCFFAYAPNYCHRYVLAVNGKCIVCTVMDIKRPWRATL